MVQASTKNQSVLQSFLGAVLMTFIGIFVNRAFQKKYEIKFAGKDAIDEGGVSREFYTGRQGLKKVFF